MCRQLRTTDTEMTERPSYDLMQLAHDCHQQELHYLSQLPSQLISSVDVAIVVGAKVLPAHTFVLIAASPVLAEALTSSVLQSPSGVAELPLLDDILDVEVALQHMYARCNLRQKTSSPEPGQDFKDALSLISFGHKYDVQPMLEDGVHCLETVMHEEQNFARTAVTLRDARMVVRFAATAENFELDQLFDYSVAWLVRYFDLYFEHLSELWELGKLGTLIMISQAMAFTSAQQRRAVCTAQRRNFRIRFQAPVVPKS